MSETPRQTTSTRTAVLSLGRCMTSEVFELVTKDDVHFYVNKDILASQSKPFREATTGCWKEATEHRIDLKDWDSDTVARLVEFLYIRDYPYPDPTPLVSKGEPTNEDPDSINKDPGSGAPPAKGPTSELDHSRPLTPFNEYLEKSLPPTKDPPATDEERLEPFDPEDYNYEEVLLAHAKVYALANYKSVDTLRALALKRLLLALWRLHPIVPASHISMNIVDLANYVYANTDDLVNSEEPLRKLTSHFIALNLAAFQTEPKAVELMAQGGDLVKDLMAKICRRIPEPEGCLWGGGHSKKGYISGIRVVYGSVSAPPEDRVLEVNGLDCNISYTYTDPYTIYLVPEYTKIAKDACTMFTVSNVAQGHATGNNLDRTHGTQLYLDPVKDGTVREKITEVALMRCLPGYTADIRSKGYDGMIGDIRNKSTNYALYLIWKTTKSRLF